MIAYFKKGEIVLFVCLFACLLVCLFACLLVCLFACLLVWPFFSSSKVRKKSQKKKEKITRVRKKKKEKEKKKKRKKENTNQKPKPKKQKKKNKSHVACFGPSFCLAQNIIFFFFFFSFFASTPLHPKKQDKDQKAIKDYYKGFLFSLSECFYAFLFSFLFLVGGDYIIWFLFFFDYCIFLIRVKSSDGSLVQNIIIT